MGQQTKSTKSKPRKRRNDGGNRVVFIIAAVLMVIYLAAVFLTRFRLHRRPHRLCMSQLMTALRAMAGSSAMKTIDNATGSSVKHIVYSGDAYSRTHRWRSSILIRNLWI